MKRYARCSICGTRALVEYGTVLREHYRPQIAPGGFVMAGSVPSICHGPRPTTTSPASDRISAEPSGEAVQVGGARTGQPSDIVQE